MTHIKRIEIAFLGILLAQSTFAHADGATVSSPNSLLNGLTFNVFLDGYYDYNFNRPPSVQTPNPANFPPSQNGPFRNFDIYSNQFSLSLAELEVSKKGKEAGFLIDFDFGTQADIVANSSGAAGTGNTDGVSKNIGQAYMTYSPIGIQNL